MKVECLLRDGKGRKREVDRNEKTCYHRITIDLRSSNYGMTGSPDFNLRFGSGPKTFKG